MVSSDEFSLLVVFFMVNGFFKKSFPIDVISVFPIDLFLSMSSRLCKCFPRFLEVWFFFSFFPLYGFYLLFFLWLRVASYWWYCDCSHLWRWKELRWARPAWWWASPGRKWQRRDREAWPSWILNDRAAGGFLAWEAELRPARAGECYAWSLDLNACFQHFWWWRESPG